MSYTNKRINNFYRNPNQTQSAMHLYDIILVLIYMQLVQTNMVEYDTIKLVNKTGLKVSTQLNMVTIVVQYECELSSVRICNDIYNYNMTTQLVNLPRSNNSISQGYYLGSKRAYNTNTNTNSSQLRHLFIHLSQSNYIKICIQTQTSPWVLSCAQSDNIGHVIQVEFGQISAQVYVLTIYESKTTIFNCVTNDMFTIDMRCTQLYASNSQITQWAPIRLSYTHNMWYYLSYNPSNMAQVQLRILVNCSSQIKLINSITYSIQIKSNQIDSIKMCVYDNYVILYSQSIVNVLYFQQWPSTPKTYRKFNVSEQIISLQVFQNIIYIIANNKIYQYTLTGLYLMDTITVFPSTIFSHSYYMQQAVLAVSYLDTIKIYKLTNSYYCYSANGCTCSAQFQFDPTLTKCLYKNNPVNQPAPVDLCYVQAQTYKCYFTCLTCDIEDPMKCLSCLPTLQLNTATGKCGKPPTTAVLVSTITTAMVFRPQGLQQIIFVSGTFQFYKYMKVQFIGTFKLAIQTLSTLQQNCWTMLPIKNVQQWVHATLPLPDYKDFTNPKFVQQQRSDSIFLQNTKSYFTIYIPVTSFLFFLLNRLFYILFHDSISIYLRSYSFWTQLIFIVVIQNIRQLTVFAITNFFNFFSTNYQIYFTHAISVVLIGFIFILAMTIFPISLYFNGKHSRYILNNLKYTNHCFLIMFFKFSIKPMLQSIVHIMLYDSPEIQLLILSVISMVAVLYLVSMEIWLNIHKLKMIFWVQIFLQWVIIIMNMLIYAEYIWDYLAQEFIVLELLQTCMQANLIAILILTVLSVISESIKSLYEFYENYKARQKQIQQMVISSSYSIGSQVKFQTIKQSLSEFMNSNTQINGIDFSTGKRMGSIIFGQLIQNQQLNQEKQFEYANDNQAQNSNAQMMPMEESNRQKYEHIKYQTKYKYILRSNVQVKLKDNCSVFSKFLREKAALKNSKSNPWK